MLQVHWPLYDIFLGFLEHDRLKKAPVTHFGPLSDLVWSFNQYHNSVVLDLINDVKVSNYRPTRNLVMSRFTFGFFLPRSNVVKTFLMTFRRSTWFLYRYFLIRKLIQIWHGLPLKVQYFSVFLFEVFLCYIIRPFIDPLEISGNVFGSSYDKIYFFLLFCDQKSYTYVAELVPRWDLIWLTTI